ncbi:cytochrome c peroxidase [Lysobacter terrae]
MNARQSICVLAVLLVAGSILAAAGGIIDTPDQDDGLSPSFPFRGDTAFQSLKEMPVWSELEQLLDNPYATTTCPPDASGRAALPNGQGFAARCATIQRRRSFLPAGCTYDASTGLPPCDDALLPRLVVHPLDYNPSTGEQMRLLNPAFPGVSSFADLGAISAGSTRIGAGDPPAIDFNSPLRSDGGDPGEPTGYSGAAVCGTDNRLGWTETRAACSGNTGRLLDPSRGIITSLAKPSVDRAYAVNSEGALASRPQDLAPSNPSDYIRDPRMAEVLGKALFWDMQLGSDGVQACASCHFSAGTDNRVRNALNPDHLGGDTQLEVFRNRHPTTEPVALDQNVNRDLGLNDFPTHKLIQQGAAGEPRFNSANVIRDSNDVVGSMGVRLRRFDDIPVPGTNAFGPANGGVRALLPDLGTAITDPIPLYQGLRRVEPRNTPTMINAAFFFDNFWDGRARHDFNGGSISGASDPQSHVIVDQNGTLLRTRQLIRFSSIASQMVGPALSDFEMSFTGRSWPKIGKKLLQGDGTVAAPNVTPLAGQLVSTSDSVLGPFSNQGGSRCVALGRAVASGRPGLCLNYRELIQQAFFDALWSNTTQHLNGTTAACISASNGVVSPAGCDPFDGFVLSLASGAAAPADRAQFTQMEANFALFAGLATQAYTDLLISDDTPFDRFLDRNPEAFRGFRGAPLPLCSSTGNRQPCFTEAEGFTRAVPARAEDDRLLGMDLFFGTNLSGRNPDFRAARCGNCHTGGLLSSNSMDMVGKLTLMDFTAEFTTPGTKSSRKALGRPRVASGFLLEALINGNAESALQRHLINQAVNGGQPEGSAMFDRGIYNIAVRPTAEDALRGGNDPWGWPLSLTTLALKNVGGTGMVPGTALPTFDPARGTAGGLFAATAQDQRLNPGASGRPLSPRLPGHLAPWVNPFPLGRAHPELGEIEVGLNTRTALPLIDSYLDLLGPFNGQARLNQQLNRAEGPLLGTFPAVNRAGDRGAAKVPQLRNVELTGPYFHNGGKLTLRQAVNFYTHGSDFPVTNGPHKAFNILNVTSSAQLVSDDRVALTAFLLSLTDERVAREQAPFDRPELFIPVDGRAPDNTGGRASLLTQTSGTSVCSTSFCFRRLLPVGAAGHSERIPAFLNVSRVAGTGPDHFEQ